jgi:hypothetical protein
MQSFIGYHFFHGAGKIQPQEAFDKTQRAMLTFSDQKTPTHLGYMLDMQTDQGGPLEKLFHDLCGRFGPWYRTTTSPTMPTYRAYIWQIDATQFKESLDLLPRLRQQDPILLERTHLHASWSFKFVEPETTSILPGQEDLPVIDVRLGPGSSLNFATGKKTSINAWFLFPFENPSAEFEKYVSRFQGRLIFKFSREHWRLWRFSSGEWRPRRFVPRWYGISE